MEEKHALSTNNTAPAAQRISGDIRLQIAINQCGNQRSADGSAGIAGAVNLVDLATEVLFTYRGHTAELRQNRWLDR